MTSWWYVADWLTQPTTIIALLTIAAALFMLDRYLTRLGARR